MSTPEPGSIAPRGLHLLIGQWTGRGVADFPTIERVEYTEELRIEWDPGREVLAYEQSVTLADGSPSHRESGFIRSDPGDEVQVWNAQDNGRTEVLRGTSSRNESAAALRLELRSVAFGNDPRMLESSRLWTVDAGRMRYEVHMMTTTTETPSVQRHLRCDLIRSPGGDDA